MPAIAIAIGIPFTTFPLGGAGSPGAGVDNLLLADGSSHFLLAAGGTDVLLLAS